MKAVNEYARPRVVDVGARLITDEEKTQFETLGEYKFTDYNLQDALYRKEAGRMVDFQIECIVDHNEIDSLSTVSFHAEKPEALLSELRRFKLGYVRV